MGLLVISDKYFKLYSTFVTGTGWKIMINPELYARSNPFQMRDASQVLGVYKKKLDTDDSDVILDIGCGTGDVTTKIIAPALGRFELLLGVDKSFEMVNYANQHCSVDNIHYEMLDIAGDVTYFREDWGTFSKIFSFYCLHWVKDLQKALKNIRYLMRPGGQCLLVFVAQCPVFTMYERMSNISKWEGFMLDVNEYIPDTHHMAQPSFVFSQMMEEAGISSIECNTLNRSFAFSSTQMLRDCVVAINPFIQRIPVSQRDEYIEDCIKTLGAIKLETGPVNENESCCFSYKLLVAQGTRN